MTSDVISDNKIDVSNLKYLCSMPLWPVEGQKLCFSQNVPPCLLLLLQLCPYEPLISGKAKLCPLILGQKRRASILLAHGIAS